jgi:hypothetical protein
MENIAHLYKLNGILEKDIGFINTYASNDETTSNKMDAKSWLH